MNINWTLIPQTAVPTNVLWLFAAEKLDLTSWIVKIFDFLYFSNIVGIMFLDNDWKTWIQRNWIAMSKKKISVASVFVGKKKTQEIIYITNTQRFIQV